MKRRLFYLVLTVVLPATLLAYTRECRLRSESAFSHEAALAQQDAERLRAQIVIYSDLPMPAGRIFASVLEAQGISAVYAAGIVSAAQVV